MVLSALVDLPAAEVDEIAEDIGPQLDELADELGERASIETLVELLGTPERYAEELRTAAGYPTVGPSRQSRLLSGLAWFSLSAGIVVALLMGVDSGLNSVRDSLHWQDVDRILVFIPLALLPAFAIAWEARGRAKAELLRTLPVYRAGSRLIQVIPAAVREYLNTLRPAWHAARIVIPIVATILAIWYPLASSLQVILPMIVLTALLLFGSRFATKRLWTVTVLCDAFVVGLVAAFVLTFFASAGGAALPHYPY